MAVQCKLFPALLCFLLLFIVFDIYFLIRCSSCCPLGTSFRTQPKPALSWCLVSPEPKRATLQAAQTMLVFVIQLLKCCACQSQQFLSSSVFRVIAGLDCWGQQHCQRFPPENFAYDFETLIYDLSVSISVFQFRIHSYHKLPLSCALSPV